MSNADRERLARMLEDHAEWYREYCFETADDDSREDVLAEYHGILLAANIVRKGGAQ